MVDDRWYACFFGLLSSGTAGLSEWVSWAAGAAVNTHRRLNRFVTVERPDLIPQSLIANQQLCRKESCASFKMSFYPDAQPAPAP